GDKLTCPPQTRHPKCVFTMSFIVLRLTSTFARTSIVSAVPAGDVIARDEVFGIRTPQAATMGTTIMDVRLPGIPPAQCLSMIAGLDVSASLQSICEPALAIARVRHKTSSGVKRAALATRKAAISVLV